jgi:hypothetical protein
MVIIYFLIVNDKVRFLLVRVIRDAQAETGGLVIFFWRRSIGVLAYWGIGVLL